MERRHGPVTVVRFGLTRLEDSGEIAPAVVVGPPLHPPSRELALEVLIWMLGLV